MLIGRVIRTNDFGDSRHLRCRVSSRATGTPQQVRARLEYLAELHGADEIMAVTNMYDFADRQRSFELLSQACSDG